MHLPRWDITVKSVIPTNIVHHSLCSAVTRCRNTHYERQDHAARHIRRRNPCNSHSTELREGSKLQYRGKKIVMLIITRMAQQCSARVWSTVRHTCSAPGEATAASCSFSKHRDKTHSLRGRSSTWPISACWSSHLQLTKKTSLELHTIW